MIQLHTHKDSNLFCSFLFFWMNHCFWTNWLNEQFSDSLIKTGALVPENRTLYLQHVCFFQYGEDGECWKWLKKRIRCLCLQKATLHLKISKFSFTFCYSEVSKQSVATPTIINKIIDTACLHCYTIYKNITIGH